MTDDSTYTTEGCDFDNVTLDQIQGAMIYLYLKLYWRQDGRTMKQMVQFRERGELVTIPYCAPHWPPAWLRFLEPYTHPLPPIREELFA